MTVKKILNNVQFVIDLKLTDQELADLCPTLSAEDIHTIRQTEQLDLLPFAAIQELSQVGVQQKKKHLLASPIREEEFHLFEKRLQDALQRFIQFQNEKFISDESHMDDDIIAHIAEEIQTKLLNDEAILLDYFNYYQHKIEEI